jgi:hypothetical protein
MTWNRQTTDCFGALGKPTRPSCQSKDCFARFELPAERETIRDLVFGPKVLAELAILRKLAAA